MTHIVKHILKRLIVRSDRLLEAIHLASGDFPKVFVYHRFSAPGIAVPHRVSADEFGWQLDQMTKCYSVLSFEKILDHYYRFGKWPKHCATVTVDDGYRDFYIWAYPELKKRKLQATFFTTVNFTAGEIWLWPDRLHWVLTETAAPEIELSLKGRLERFPLREAREKAAAWKTLNDFCITLGDHSKEMFIRSVEEALQVTCPKKPTHEFSAATWNELREMSSNGVEIGSHTMNHPILSRINRARLEEEVATSKRILEEKLGQAVKSFCYPNSGPEDITDEVTATVRKAGYAGAVFGTNLGTWNPFQVPRMGATNSRVDFLWKLYGGEAFRIQGTLMAPSGGWCIK